MPNLPHASPPSRDQLPAAGAPHSIVHVLAPARVGGLESVVTMLAAAQQARGHRVTIAAVVEPAVGEHPFLAAVERAGLPLARLEVRGRDYRGERAAVAALCRERGATVVHTHGFRPDVVDAPVARRLGIATVSTVHGFVGGTLRGRVYEWLQERSYRRFDAVVAVSRPIVARLLRRGVPAERLQLVPNALAAAEAPLPRAAARAALGLPAEGFVVGWVGRLSREKGPDVAIDALTHAGAGTRLAILGDGRDRAALEARAAAAGVADRVSWHGVVPGAARLLAAFDAFALSSRTEGTPIALLEAMAAGVPAVATAVGGVPDVLQPGHGLLVPAEAPALLGAAIVAVRDDPQGAARRAAAARAHVATAYAIEPWAERHDALYDRITGRRPAPRVQLPVGGAPGVAAASERRPASIR